MPASPVPGANVIPDPIVELDEELDALDVPLANEIAGTVVNVQPVELYHY